jgi:hypothetical protein
MDSTRVVPLPALEFASGPPLIEHRARLRKRYGENEKKMASGDLCAAGQGQPKQDQPGPVLPKRHSARVDDLGEEEAGDEE